MSPTDEPTEETAETPERPGHEESDVDPVQIVLWAVGLAVLTALAAFVVAVLYASSKGVGLGAVFDRVPTPWEGAEPPEPRLQVDTLQLPREVEARERERLENWEWVNRDQGVARIPVERAKELVVERYEQGAETRWRPDNGETDETGGDESEEAPSGESAD